MSESSQGKIINPVFMGIAFACLGGLIGGFVVAAALLPHGFGTRPENILYHYQALIAGIGAVAAAGVSVFFLKKQISLQSENHDKQMAILHETQIRKKRAHRSALHVLMGNFGQYCIECQTFMAEVYPSLREYPDEWNSHGNRPSWNLSDVYVLFEHIEIAGEEYAEQMDKILHCLQLIDANIRKISQRDHPNCFDTLLFLLPITMCKIEVFINYARRNTSASSLPDLPDLIGVEVQIEALLGIFNCSVAHKDIMLKALMSVAESSLEDY